MASFDSERILREGEEWVKLPYENRCPKCGKRLIAFYNVAVYCEDCDYILASG